MLLLDAILADVPGYYTSVLGPAPKGGPTKRRCYNSAAHKSGDASPSLGFNPQNGGYRCFSCGVSGNVFHLYMHAKGVSYGEAIAALRVQYGIQEENLHEIPSKTVPRKGRGQLYTSMSPNDKEYNEWMGTIDKWSPTKLEFMAVRYGLTPATIKAWGLKIVRGRVAIPIPARDYRKVKRDSHRPSLVNIRYHDCFRTACRAWRNVLTDEVTKRPDHITEELIARQQTEPWRPEYGGVAKVLSVKGHGSTYLYPLEALLEPAELYYLTGGELKALLLNQVGCPAVAFTTGEGAYNEGLLYLFIGKRIRVLMDPDKAGEEAAVKLAWALAEAGAHVWKGVWTDKAKALLPPKGDVTDLLREHEWHPSCLDDGTLIEWHLVEPDLTPPQLVDELGTPTEVILAPGEELPAKPISFGELVRADKLFQRVSVSVTIGGTTAVPYAAYRVVTWSCPAGKASQQEACSRCRLPREGYRLKTVFPADVQVQMCGMTPEEQLRLAKYKSGIPPKCMLPEAQVTYSAVLPVVLSPSFEETAADQGEHSILLDTREAHMFATESLDLEENAPYRITGQMFPHPQNGKFTLGCSRWERVETPLFAWRPVPEEDARLEQVLGGGVGAFLSLLRRHILRIHGQDDMVLAILASMFMPLLFKLGNEYQERKCSVVMIVGDTTTGKSHVARALTSYYSAGHVANADANMTLAGLIGGMMKGSGNTMRFQWGILPLLHRRFLALDEMHKMDEQIIRGMTGLLSSGSAQRTLVGGDTHRAPASLRLLYMANPRTPKNGGRAPKLSNMHNPFDAIGGVLGAREDISRLDLSFIQLSAAAETFSPESLLDSVAEPTEACPYDEKLARYHLAWAWTRGPEDFIFEDVRDIVSRSYELAALYGDNPAFLPSNARLKLARLAGALASILFSHTADHKVWVSRSHVDLAVDFIGRHYSKWLLRSDHSTLSELPEQVIALLQKVHDLENLGFLGAGKEYVTWDDVLMLFRGNESLTEKFLGLMTLNLGIFTRTGPRYYLSSQHAAFPEQIRLFMRQEAIRRRHS